VRSTGPTAAADVTPVVVSSAPFGDAARRVALPEGASGRAVLDALRALPRVVDAVVTERHALVTFDPAHPPEGIELAVETALAAPTTAARPREHVVRARYGGPDLEAVARRVGLSPEDVVALHAGGAYVVAVIGFLPGFAYLRGLDPRLVVPRLEAPRTRIEPLSIAIAGPYTGVYPLASPGGWNIVGVAVDFTPFDAASGAALAIGDRVTFVREPS
jgi:5-oxoprolinase (ATP-hydrolysing) subunit A